jgi:hypothetical protein
MTTARELTREAIEKALIAAALDSDSVLKRLAEIVHADSDKSAAKDGNSNRAIDIWAKIAGAYAPEKKEITTKEIEIGIEKDEEQEDWA